MLSIINYMSHKDSYIYSFICLCPLCGGYTFSQHWMHEYSRDWNKCSSCGYMEEKTVSLKRAISKLDPDRLDKPFVDPVTDKLIKESTDIRIYGKTSKRKNNRSSKVNSVDKD